MEGVTLAHTDMGEALQHMYNYSGVQGKADIACFFLLFFLHMTSVCVCMYVCMFACMHVCMHACPRVYATQPHWPHGMTCRLALL